MVLAAGDYVWQVVVVASVGEAFPAGRQHAGGAVGGAFCGVEVLVVGQGSDAAAGVEAECGAAPVGAIACAADGAHACFVTR